MQPSGIGIRRMSQERIITHPETLSLRAIWHSGGFIRRLGHFRPEIHPSINLCHS